MLIKYIDPETNCTVIQEFTDVFMDKNENADYKFEMTFLCDMSVVCVFCNSFSLVNEYMNNIFDNNKIDFSADANVFIHVERADAEELENMQDAFREILESYYDEDDDEDSDYPNDISRI